VYTYTNGHNTAINLDNGLQVWQLTDEPPLGMPSSAQTGALTRTYGYDAYGLPTARSATNGNATIQDFSYNFASHTGNLNWRKDNTRNLQENFGYDAINRLTSLESDSLSYGISYNRQGNIVDHSLVGFYEYDSSGPYAVANVLPYSNEIPQSTQDITYNTLMRPASIIENGDTAVFTYNGSGDRVKMVLSDSVSQRIRYYTGGRYEIDLTPTGTKERLYLAGDAYSAPAVYTRENGGGWTVNYILRDYLGSITHVADARERCCRN
jgi:YD repeat-containing protein